MTRIKAVQQALDGRVKRVYLETGVEFGRAFGRISADEKIAVDPGLELSARSRRLADAKARTTYYFESCATSRTPCATCGTTASLSCTTAAPQTARSPAPHRRSPTFVRRTMSGISSSTYASPKRRESSTSISPACAAAIRAIRLTAGGCSPR